MKKIILSFIVLMLSAIPSFAQFGIEAGYQNYFYSDSGTNDGNNYSGFNLGLVYNFTLGRYFSIREGIGYSFGSRNDGITEVKIFGQELITESTTLEHTAYLPILFQVNIPVKKSNFLFFAGPNLTYTFSGSNTLEFTDSEEKKSTKLYTYDKYNNKFKSENIPEGFTNLINSNLGAPMYEKFDVRLRIGGGFQVRKWFLVQCSYEVGMLNRYADKSLGNLKVQGFNAGAAFLF